MAYFPMFVDLTGQKCLVVGGGKVALRKVQVLLDFDAVVHVVAREISEDILRISDERLFLEEREFAESDIEGCALVVVATDEGGFNQRISELCRGRHIPVNVVDDKEKCSFIFPSYVKEKNLVGAFTSSGNSPVLAQYIKDKASEIITPRLGELNEALGTLRPMILDEVKDEKTRKIVFKRIIEEAIAKDEIPTEREITGL